MSILDDPDFNVIRPPVNYGARVAGSSGLGAGSATPARRGGGGSFAPSARLNNSAVANPVPGSPAGSRSATRRPPVNGTHSTGTVYGPGSNSGASRLNGAAGAGRPNTPAGSNPNVVDPPAKPSFDARAMFATQLRNYGFSEDQINSLVGDINMWMNDWGWTQETVVANLASTAAFKDRFRANDARMDAGYNPLSFEEYMAAEDGYRQAINRYGIDVNRYGSRDRIDNWIAGNVSVDEIYIRARMASVAARSWANDTFEGQTARSWYGDAVANDVTGFFFDRQRGEDELAEIDNTIQIGSEFLRQGIEVGREYGTYLTTLGYSRTQARQVATQTALTQDNYTKLAEIAGEGLTNREIIDANFGLNANSQGKLDDLNQNERARFGSGGSGTTAFRNDLRGQF